MTRCAHFLISHVSVSSACHSAFPACDFVCFLSIRKLNYRFKAQLKLWVLVLQELEDSLSSPAGCTSGEESEGGTQISSPCRSSVTLFTLLRERLLAPGEGAMSIHYLVGTNIFFINFGFINCP